MRAYLNVAACCSEAPTSCAHIKRTLSGLHRARGNLHAGTGKVTFLQPVLREAVHGQYSGRRLAPLLAARLPARLVSRLPAHSATVLAAQHWHGCWGQRHGGGAGQQPGLGEAVPTRTVVRDEVGVKNAQRPRQPLTPRQPRHLPIDNWQLTLSFNDHSRRPFQASIPGVQRPASNICAAAEAMAAQEAEGRPA
jgi:hypothetical protein